MKSGVFILLALLVLVATGKYLYDRFLNKPKIQIDVFTGKILTEQKIYYIVNYAGVVFNGVYDLKTGTVKEETAGAYQIKTSRNGLIFGLQILKEKKVLYSVYFDITKQKLTLNL